MVIEITNLPTYRTYSSKKIIKAKFSNDIIIIYLHII
jgi:hypothetical protein